jgi:hypothetical protein
MRSPAAQLTWVIRACWSTQLATCPTSKRSRDSPAYPISPMPTSQESVSNNPQRWPRLADVGTYGPFRPLAAEPRSQRAPRAAPPRVSRPTPGVRVARDIKLPCRRGRGPPPPPPPDATCGSDHPPPGPRAPADLQTASDALQLRPALGVQLDRQQLLPTPKLLRIREGLPSPNTPPPPPSGNRDSEK